MKHHHEITLQGLQEWINETETTYASSTRERKRLTIDCKGGIKITVNGKIVWQGIQPFAAVEEYNSITKRFVPEEFKL